MFDISQYDFGRVQEKTDDRMQSCGAYNIVFNMGAGANWLAWATCNTLLGIDVPINTQNNEVMQSRNALIVDVLHPWDIRYCVDSEWLVSKLLRNNLIIIDMNLDQLNNVYSLARLKYHLNVGHPSLKDVPIQTSHDLEEYRCIQDFKQYAIKNISSDRLHILDYKTFFIDADGDAITKYAEFFNIFNESVGGRTEAFEQMLRKYTFKNAELMKEYNMEHVWQWNS